MALSNWAVGLLPSSDGAYAAVYSGGVTDTLVLGHELARNFRTGFSGSLATAAM